MSVLHKTSNRVTIGELIDSGEILVHKDGNHGGKYPKTSEFGKQGVPFLTAKLVSDNGNINLKDAPRLAHQKAETFTFGFIETGDVLLSHNATIGRVAIVPELNEKVLIGTSLTHFRVDNSKLLPRYLAVYFSSRDFQMQLRSVMSQTTRDQVPITSQRNLSIILPSISEQETLVNFNSAFDDKIELLQAQNKTLETMAQTIFKEWFGKYQIGDELPDGWRVGILDDLFGELATGNRPKGGVGNLSSGIPSIGAESIGGISNFDYSKTKYISKEFFLNMKRGIVKEYDILIYKDGGKPGTFIPKFSMFGEGFPFKEFCINSHVFRVQPKKIHHRFYIYQWLNSYYCKWQLKNIGGKAAIPGINSTDLKNLDVIIPCDKLLYKYHDLVKNKYKKILKNMIQIQSLTKTRDTLLPKLMSGQVRVNNIKQTANA